MTKQIAYKGFNKDLTCRNFQYEIGKTYKHEGDVVRCAEGGFHACLNPLDIFQYYNPADSVFCAVEIDGTVDSEKDGDSKVASSVITICENISLHDLCMIGADLMVENSKTSDNSVKHYSASTNTGNYSASTNTGNYSASTNTGHRSASTNTGDCSASTNTGYRSASTNTGKYSASTNTGDCSASTNTGNYSASTNTGDCSASTNTGDCSASTNTGNYSASTNTGDCSASTNTGKYSASTNTGDCSASTNTGKYSASTVGGVGSVALVIGSGSKASACLGSAVVLIHKDQEGKVIKVVTGIAGIDIEPDVFYTLDGDGKLIKAEGE